MGQAGGHDCVCGLAPITCGDEMTEHLKIWWKGGLVETCSKICLVVRDNEFFDLG